MTFFYDLNKRLAQLASKQDAKQITEEAKAVAPKSKLVESMEVAEAGYSAKAGRAGKDLGKPGKNFGKIAKSAGERYGSKAAGERVAGAVLNKLRHPKESAEQGDVMDYLNDKLKDFDAQQTKEGNAFSGAVAKAKADGIQKGETIRVGSKIYPVKEAGTPMTPKQKSFAKLAPPVDKITFADKIAGAKKEVDEMLGDVAAEAIKKAVKKSEPRSKGTAFDAEFMKQQQVKKDAESHSRYDVQDTGYSKRYTRKAEPEAEKDDTEVSDTPKRRGRPKGADKGPERTTKGAWKHKGARKVKEEETDEGWRGGLSGERDLVKTRKPAAGSNPQEQAYNELGAFLAGAKIRGLIDPHYIDQITKLVKQLKPTTDLEEKAVSKKQQKFMGMVHATQKGEKAPSKEVAKVAKEMPKKAAKDFAATKHKGLPEKAKAKKEESKEDKVEETTTAGSVSTAPAKAGKGDYNFGGGVYEGFNNRVESMITEGMSINISVDEQGKKSISVNATEQDAEALADLLKMAGLGGQSREQSCPTCSKAPCGCAEVVDENSPDYPTNTETSDDALQYSGGLNGPKSTGQTTVPVVASQLRRQVSMEESVELERNLFKTWKNYKG